MRLLRSLIDVDWIILAFYKCLCVLAQFTKLAPSGPLNENREEER